MGVLRVRESFSFDLPGGVPVVMRTGHLVDEKDPCVQGRRELFEPAENATRTATAAAVETATAAPGERRSVSRSARRAEANAPAGGSGTEGEV